MRVETVRGAKAVDGLRTTLMHEHVFVPTPDVMQNYGHEWWDEQDRVPGAVRQTAGAQGRRRRQHRRPDRGGLGRSIPRAAAGQRAAAFLKGVVEERGLTAMLVHNPARYFTGGQE